jgi:integrase
MSRRFQPSVEKPAPGIFIKHGRYYKVIPKGKKRVWHPLTKVKDGLPALYAALSKLLDRTNAGDAMPVLIADWEGSVMASHATKTQTDERGMLKTIAEAFIDFRAGDVRAPDIAQFLTPMRDKARTHNRYRSMLRELMRYAIERGYRTDNPVDHIRTMQEKPRTRYITDSELRRIKVGGIYGDDGRRNRSGLMLAALIDMAYLTGQDIGMLLALRWTRDPVDADAPHVTRDGLFFRRAKVRGSTGAAVLIQWTPALKDVVERLRSMRSARLLKKRAEQRIDCEYLFTTQSGTAITYSGASTAWKRAVKRAGVAGVMFRDLRAKALTDKEERDGMQAARHMGSHATESQTADYVRHKTARKTGATR